jgi:hypothetical protein
LANFLIQTIDGQVRHDFSFALMESIDYQNWLHKGSHDYVLCDLDDMFESDFADYTPSGTIQFVQKFLASYHDMHSIKPINIPTDLFWKDFLKRGVTIKTEGSYLFDDDKFVKSDTILKGHTNVVRHLDIPIDGRYLVSDLINIDSEWRCFVFNGELVGMQNYLGDFTTIPDIHLIKEMISEYKGCPPAYTLDVGINEDDGTFLIECHNFYSCGTYGFSNNTVIPQMIYQSFRHLVKNKF